jgi:hypothetical protein
MVLCFSCSLIGGRQYQPVNSALVSHLQALGHRVLTAHLAADRAILTALSPGGNRESHWPDSS